MSESRTILVVDDEAMNREILEAFLTSESYEVILAHNGQQALKLLTHEPDLVILDVRMPDMSGYDVCRQIKASESFQHIPIMFVSGYDREEDRARGEAAGASDFISRPFDGDDLLQRVKGLLTQPG